MPLHEAASRGHCEVVQMLLKLQAPLLPRTASNQTPYDLAFQNNHHSLAQLLSKIFLTLIVSTACRSLPILTLCLQIDSILFSSLTRNKLNWEGVKVYFNKKVRPRLPLTGPIDCGGVHLTMYGQPNPKLSITALVNTSKVTQFDFVRHFKPNCQNERLSLKVYGRLDLGMRSLFKHCK